MSKIVCAFRGRRDNYQVPIALAEAGKLDQFITDFYATAPVRSLSRLGSTRLREKIEFRHCSAIPADRVRSLWLSTAIEHLRHAAGISRRQTYRSIDVHYSLAARDRARESRANLLLYTPYAWEAFNAKYEHRPHKALFQYHPHTDFEKRVLAADVEQYPEAQRSFAEETGEHFSIASAPRERDAWKHADLIICASSFTKRTLTAAGAAPERCHVVPYGVELPRTPINQAPGDFFQALFVGSGVQRKGLHHLLRAWKAAKLRLNRRLILVCRTIDPGIATLIAGDPSISVRQRISANDLAHLYATSSLLVMPSLIEGFGQVFLEALAWGCPVLGTPNTCLPDLGGEDDGVFSCDAGRLDLLVTMLERLATELTGNVPLRQQAHACAARFTWQRFRRDLLQHL